MAPANTSIDCGVLTSLHFKEAYAFWQRAVLAHVLYTVDFAMPKK